MTISDVDIALEHDVQFGQDEKKFPDRLPHRCSETRFLCAVSCEHQMLCSALLSVRDPYVFNTQSLVALFGPSSTKVHTMIVELPRQCPHPERYGRLGRLYNI
jgi:hypothetical protein